jgi:hypothetical protein
MLALVAKAVLAIAALYFLAFGTIALIRPQHAKRFLLGFADTAAKHYAELFLRMLVGGSLLIVATTSRYSTVLTVFGWILVLSTAAMALMLWRMHRRFAQSSVPKALRFLPLIGLSSLAMGVSLFGAVLGFGSF